MKISSLLVVLLLVASLHTTVLGFPWRMDPSTLIHDSVEVHLLGDPFHSATHRHARHVHAHDVMPSKLHFRLRFGERHVSLRIARNTVGGPSDPKRGLGDFPVFVIEDGQIRRKQLQRESNVDLYYNETTGSSFVVRKSSNRTQFILEGLFYDGLDQLQLSRDPTGGFYRIHKQAREVDFQDDYVKTISNEGVTPRSDSSTRPPHIYQSHARVKRQLDAGGEHEIRLFMVADYKDYKTWLSYYNNNATLTHLGMNLYYTFVANSINIRYSSVNKVDPSFSLGVVVTGLLIVDSRLVGSWTEENRLKAGSSYVDASKALDAFGLWVKDKNGELPLSDHWMLFTGFDIYTDRNPHVAGLAKLRGMCSLSSISIIEQDNTGSVGATAAHELGHSLGSLHDGDEKDCLDEDNFIMSRKLKTPDDEKIASRPWQFSVCSVRAFKRFVSNGECTRKSSRGQNMLSTSLSPGQVFTADKQCQLALGNGSYFGRGLQFKEGYASMCRRMYCAVPKVPALYQAIFSMEKTSCGDKKWCQRGSCVTHEHAPSVEDNCPQGDDPTAPCVQEDCRYYSQHTKIVFCCHTCRGTRPIWADLVGTLASEGGVFRPIEESPAAVKPLSAQMVHSKHVTSAINDHANSTPIGPPMPAALNPSTLDPTSPQAIYPSQASRTSTTVVPQSLVTDPDVLSPQITTTAPNDETTLILQVNNGITDVTTTSLNDVPPAQKQDVTTGNITLAADGLSRASTDPGFVSDLMSHRKQSHSATGLTHASSSLSDPTLVDANNSERGSSPSVNTSTAGVNVNAQKLNPDQNFVVLQNITAPVRLFSPHQGLNMVTDVHGRPDMVTDVHSRPDAADRSRGHDIVLNIVADLKDHARSLEEGLDNVTSSVTHGDDASPPRHHLEVMFRSRDSPSPSQSSYTTSTTDDKTNTAVSAANHLQHETESSVIHSNLNLYVNSSQSPIATGNDREKLPTPATDSPTVINSSKIATDITLTLTTISTASSSIFNINPSTTIIQNHLSDEQKANTAVTAMPPISVKLDNRAIPTTSGIDTLLDPKFPFTPSNLQNRVYGIDALKNRHESNTISLNLHAPTVASPSEIPTIGQGDISVATDFGLADGSSKTGSDSRAILPGSMKEGELFPRTNSEAQANRWRILGNAPAVFENSRPYNFHTSDTVDYALDFLVPQRSSHPVQRTPAQKENTNDYLSSSFYQKTVGDKQQVLNTLINLMSNRLNNIYSTSKTNSQTPASTSYQENLDIFSEGFSSSQTSTSSPLTSTTDENDTPTIVPKCRFQCVFYHEPLDPPQAPWDEIGRYLLSSARMSASIPAADSTALSRLMRLAAFQPKDTNLKQKSHYLPSSIAPKVNKLKDSLISQILSLQDPFLSIDSALQGSLLPKVIIAQDSVIHKDDAPRYPVIPKDSTFENSNLSPRITSLPTDPLQKILSLEGSVASKVTSISHVTGSEKQHLYDIPVI